MFKPIKRKLSTGVESVSCLITCYVLQLFCLHFVCIWSGRWDIRSPLDGNVTDCQALAEKLI